MSKCLGICCVRFWNALTMWRTIHTVSQGPWSIATHMWLLCSGVPTEGALPFPTLCSDVFLNRSPHTVLLSHTRPPTLLLLCRLTSGTPCLSLLSPHLYLGSSSPVFHPGYPKSGRLCLERHPSKWYMRSYYSSKIIIGSTATALSGPRREAA